MAYSKHICNIKLKSELLNKFNNLKTKNEFNYHQQIVNKM